MLKELPERRKLLRKKPKESQQKKKLQEFKQS